MSPFIASKSFPCLEMSFCRKASSAGDVKRFEAEVVRRCDEESASRAVAEKVKSGDNVKEERVEAL